MKLHIYILCLLFISSFIYARDKRVLQIPNGTVNSCANCHINPAGGGERNLFGKLVEAKFLTEPGFAGNVIWGPELAMLDADNDGVSNGDELQDRYGAWIQGNSAPGNSSFVSLPGNGESKILISLQMNFSNMVPHQGQLLELRVIDKSTMLEVFRTKNESITSDFAINIENLVSGQSYFVDFYADHNGNGIYDPPPADHAWRVSVDNVQGTEVLLFTHNTDFTDIDWPYMLTINFSNMTPHVGQLLELRIENDNTSTEIYRTNLTISSDNFSLNIPGLKTGNEYKIEFYADLNNNGVYDAPPTDHAWELNVSDVQGNKTVDFTHNTNFNDINWKYIASVNFLGMTPHLGQLSEFRVVDNDSEVEIGRIKLDNILVENFTVKIPGIEIGHNYNFDFYADHNNNGNYDAPPVDHAWRITFNSSNGNYVTNFTHNTNFTDIQWPFATSVKTDDKLVPKIYSLKQNYPNPFNPNTNISFSIPNPSNVQLKIFDILGNEISTLINGFLQPGNYTANFEAANLPSGIYLYRITANNFISTKKMILIK